MKTASTPRAEWALLLLPGLIWGASYLFIAQGLEALAPDGITFARFAIGFLALSLAPGARRPLQKGDRLKVIGLGAVWMAFPMSMFPHAEQHVSSALTGMLTGMVPLMATAVAAIIGRKWPSAIILAGLAVGLLGAAAMALSGTALGGSSSAGICEIALALACYGIGINMARPLHQRNGALPVVWHAIGVAMILTAPFGAPALFKVQWQLWPLLCVLALGLLGTAAAYVLMATATGRLGATRASLTTFLIPVVALVLGVAVRGEHVGQIALAGGALSLAGAWLARLGTLRDRPA